MGAFRQIGNDLYTCVAPPGMELDPAILRAIHEFDEGAIPIWRIQVWEFPWDDQYYRVIHHGIARYLPVPRYLRRPFYCAMPADAAHPAPNFLDVIFEDQESRSYKMGGPGGFIPWRWNVYYWCRWQFDRNILARWEAAIDRRKVNMEKWRQQYEADLEYSKKQIEGWITKKLEGVSDADWKEALELMWNKPKGHRLKPSKPFVHLGDHLFRSPRNEKTYGRVAPD